jgi:hypothetical protein
VSEAGSASESGLSPARGLAGLIAANVSLIVAIMVYMGWAYENAFFRYFGLSAIQIGISPQDYLLFSLNLFNPVIVVAVVAVIAIATTTTRSAALARTGAEAVTATVRLVRTEPRLGWLSRRITPGLITRLSGLRRRWWKPRVITAAIGGAMTAASLILYAIAGDVPVSAYLVLTLLAAGPLLLAGALRGPQRGRVPYALAIVVFIVCALWAGSLYATGVGTRAAAAYVAAPATKAMVYSNQSLMMSGAQAPPSGSGYRYLYQHLILLHMDSGTYYLLAPPGTTQWPEVFVLNASDNARVILYPGSLP